MPAQQQQIQFIHRNGAKAMTTYGIDATHPATNSLVEIGTNLLGASPGFFGRYFKAPNNPSPIQYQAAQENQLLANLGIRVLCIGRQTPRVGGSESDGTSDAVSNMAAVVAAFGLQYLKNLGVAPLIFLDVEPSTPLNADYFYGWATALKQQGPGPLGLNISFTPAIYLNQSDNSSWLNLSSAIERGANCFGAWVARYGSRTGAEGPPAWSDVELSPTGVPSPCPIIGWQYAGDYEDVLDFSLLRPDDIGNETMTLLIPPPSA